MMKKIVGLLVLTLCVCTTVSAQNNGDSYAAYKKFLDRERVAYEMDGDGDLVFRYQGGNFFISRSANDPAYLQINMPGIYDLSEIEEADRVMVLFNVMSALNEVSANTKVVKGYITNNSVWLTAEMYLDDSPELEDFFFRVLDNLHTGRQRFSRAMDF